MLNDFYILRQISNKVV